MTKKTHSAFVLGRFCALPGVEHWKQTNVSALTDLNAESLEWSEALLEGMQLCFEQSLNGFFHWEERKIFLKRLSEKISDKKESLAHLISQEVSKPIALALLEVERSLQVIHHTLLAMPSFETSEVLQERLQVQRVPKGPLLAITPFNFPWNLVIHKVIPALALGCPVLLKPSPKGMLTALALADFCKSLGLPEGFLNVVPASPEVLQHWIKDARTTHISFTGSAKIGWHLKSLFPTKSFTLELGGAAPVFVDKDSATASTAKDLAQSSFQYAGQLCISTQNIYIESSEFEVFQKQFLEATQNLSIDFCACALESPEATERHQFMDKALKEGKLRVLFKRMFPGTDLSPLEVYEVLDSSWKFYQEEIFAPIVFLHRILDQQTWIQHVNEYPARLQCSIYSKNLKNFNSLAAQLNYGGVIFNGPTTLRLDEMPYGGEGLSGTGREGPRYAMESYTRLQSLVFVKPS